MAVKRLIDLGYWVVADKNGKLLSFENQSYECKTEYAAFVQENIRSGPKSELNTALNLSQSFGNKLKGIVKMDYGIITGRDAAVWMASHIKSFQAGESAAITDIQARKMKYAKFTRKPVKEKYSMQESSDKVQEAYEGKKEGFESEIINEFKPIVDKIAEKRRGAPNFSKEDLMSEIEVGHRGIYDLIGEYSPESAT